MTKRSAAAEFESMTDESGAGEEMDLSGITQVFGMTRWAVKDCIARGAPVVYRPRSKLEQWRINAGEFGRWLVLDSIKKNDSPAGQYRDAKTRKKVADAERIERLNDLHRAESLTVAEAQSLYADEAAVIRRSLNQVAPATVKALAALTADERRNPSIVEIVIADAVNAAMARICADNGGDHAEAA